MATCTNDFCSFFHWVKKIDKATRWLVDLIFYLELVDIPHLNYVISYLPCVENAKLEH